MERTILSICITTLNRASFIGQTLDSILAQITDEVEIVVVDGASTDGTENILRNYQRKYPQLRYFRMERNSGVDRDYDRSVTEARGKYCWFMSDDDVLVPDAIRVVLNAIRKEYSVVVVNAEDWNADFTRQLGGGRLRDNIDRIYAPADNDSFFMDVAHHLSFIPALVIRREIWLERERERYFGSWFAHVGVVFQAPLPRDAFVIGKPLIVIRNDNISWGSRIFEIWMFRWPDLVWSLPNYPDTMKQIICPRNPSGKWRILFAHRALAAYSQEEYRNLVRRRIPSWRHRMIPFAISIVPVRIANFLSFIYGLINYPGSRTALISIMDSRFFLFPGLRDYIRRRL
jgi:glycosyltransferase involved in cell wall biosynthesis